VVLCWLVVSGISLNPTKNYQNLIIGFQVTAKNVGDVFGDTVYITDSID